MAIRGTASSFGISCFVFSLSLQAQTFVYAGREYLKAGRSWTQIREFDLSSGRKVQLTSTPWDHYNPWCAPDGRSILFTSGTSGPLGAKGLYRFDRTTKEETPLLILDQALYSVVAAIDRSRIVVQEYGGIIDILDLNAKKKVRQIRGVNVALAFDRRWMAWQTPVDTVLHPEQRSHVLISGIDGTGQLDLGEGAVPVFLPGNETLMFVRSGQDAKHLDVVRYNLASKQKEVRNTEADWLGEPYALTVSPGGSTILLSACCGRYGTAVYWRLGSTQKWGLVDDNLHGWGGWSQGGLLVYATDGRDLRPLDANRSVWVGDIKLFDSASGQVRTIVQGIGQNQDPCWCGPISR
jgi:hypothetical protein